MTVSVGAHVYSTLCYLGQPGRVCLSEKVTFDQKPEGGREPWKHLRDKMNPMFRVVPI